MQVASYLPHAPFWTIWQNVSNVSVAGVNVRNIASGQISATDVVMLASAITSKKVPLSLNVNIGVKNPTDRSALLTTMD